MKRALIVFAVSLAIVLASFFVVHGSLWGQEGKVRPAMVAGAFYPADPEQLRTMVDGLLSNAQSQKIDGALIALISPHAGYAFSGPTAAQAYALLKGRTFKRVVVISPSHFLAFPFASVYDGDAYTTPLGTVPVDKEFAAKLAASSPMFRLSSSGHNLAAGRGEHAIEDELPFLQRTLGGFKLVPVVMGEQDYTIDRALGIALASLIKAQGNANDPDTLIVASSDLSHYHPYDQAVQLDHKVLGGIADGDYFSLSQNFEQHIWEACGGGPIVAAMIAAERLGANRRIILKYANSGDVTDDKSSVVGYGSAAIFEDKKQNSAQPAAFSLTAEDEQALLAIARKSVETAVRGHSLLALPDHLPETLAVARGAFVTLKEHGQLRGCIGYITPTKALAETVRDVAASAALNDHRFTPVTADELNQLDYEISVLSPLRRVKNVEDIDVGRDGLLLRRGDSQGLLLPQVPTEQGWDRTTFIEQTSVKAGLQPHAWQDPDADLFAFSAFVFGDHTSSVPATNKNPGLDKMKVDQ